MPVLDPLARHPSAKRVLKRIRELEPYAAIEKPDATGVSAAWIFIHRQHWAGELVVSTRTISRSLETLEGLAFIERQQAFQSRGWGREVHVCLTSKGRVAAEQLVASKSSPRQVKAGILAAGSGQDGTSKLPPRQHISKLEKPIDTEIPEEKEILLHSPDGDCRFREEGKSERRLGLEIEDEGETIETQLEAMFRRCFRAAFPQFRVPVATQASLQLIADLTREVRSGDWTLAEIEATWSRIFPMWWRFVTDTAVRSYDRQRPDRFCAVTYLGEMFNYFRDHERVLEEEAALGPLAPSELRRAVFDAFQEAGGIRNLIPRDPDDATSQLYEFRDHLEQHGVVTREGIRFVVRVACWLEQAGKEGIKYWTPEYANIGWNIGAYLHSAIEQRRDPQIKRRSNECVREFAARLTLELPDNGYVDQFLRREMDEATKIAIRLAIGDVNGDPLALFKASYLGNSA